MFGEALVCVCVFIMMRIRRMSCPDKMFCWSPITVDTITVRILLTKVDVGSRNVSQMHNNNVSNNKITYMLASWQWVFHSHSSDDCIHVQQILRLSLVKIFPVKEHLSSCYMLSNLAVVQTCLASV